WSRWFNPGNLTPSEADIVRRCSPPWKPFRDRSRLTRRRHRRRSPGTRRPRSERRRGAPR
ncbi:MAG: hypothetical protein AVDCRST_MAG88-2063, partial [uncultured Thermomicrobiales bacterium]